MKHYDAETFAAEFAVSRETVDRLAVYAALLAKWQARINLVGPKTLPAVWDRHIRDSAQLWPLLPDGAGRLIDLGSGAGFPGLVLAILGLSEVHLVESDQRKCAFLRDVARATESPVTVHSKRIEAADLPKADLVTARALAPLPDLLRLGYPHTVESGEMLFLKGKSWRAELTEAEKAWRLTAITHPSRTDPNAVVLRLKEVGPRER